MIDEGAGAPRREEHERARALGLSRRRSGIRPAEDQPRVLGIPRDWFAVNRREPGSPTIDLRRIAHPVRWLKWRRALRRLGPYAPDYDDIVRPGQRFSRPTDATSTSEPAPLDGEQGVDGV